MLSRGSNYLGSNYLGSNCLRNNCLCHFPGIQDAIVQTDTFEGITGQQQTRMALQVPVNRFQPGRVPNNVLRYGPVMPENSNEIRLSPEAKDVLQIGFDAAEQLFIIQHGQFGCSGTPDHGAQQDRTLRCAPRKYIGVDDGAEHGATFF